ncbi:MAG: TetR/AcrR family transcriptional regulator [Streptococcus sp.]|nr:TetR/AcrR family transcriptional regulator [Streptococcus sp.]
MDNRKIKTQLQIKESLISLLKTNRFDDITALMIAQTAGISRSGFYTHFKDKYEIIDKYQESIMIKIEYIFEKYKENSEESFIEFFEFFKKEQLLALLISSNGSNTSHSYIIAKLKVLIIPRLTHLNLTPTELEYTTVYLAHCFFGICQHWVLRQFKDSPQELSKIILSILPKS